MFPRTHTIHQIASSSSAAPVESFELESGKYKGDIGVRVATETDIIADHLPVNHHFGPAEGVTQ